MNENGKARQALGRGFAEVVEEQVSKVRTPARKKAHVPIGEQFRERREQLELTLRGASELVLERDPEGKGITGSGISLIETGRVKTPGFHLVVKLCAAYGLDPASVARRAGYVK